MKKAYCNCIYKNKENVYNSYMCLIGLGRTERQMAKSVRIRWKVDQNEKREKRKCSGFRRNTSVVAEKNMGMGRGAGVLSAAPFQVERTRNATGGDGMGTGQGI